MPRRLVVLVALAALGCRAPGSPATADPGPSREAGRRLVYQGEGSLEGHFRRPGETRPFGLTMTFRTDGAVHRLDTTSWTEPDRSDASTETLWVVPGAVVRLRPDPSSPAPVRLAGDDAAAARDLVLSALELDASGSPRRRRVAHPRLGDVVDQAIYGAVRQVHGASAAGTLALSRHELDQSWTASLRLVSAERDTAADLSVPAPLPTADPPPAPGPAVVEPVAEGVFQVALAAEETRTLVVELASSLVVLEASLTVAAGERIVDALAARFPGKPIRYVLFGHHHPHYTGGLRAFAAAGATVLAPRAGARLAGALLRRRFALAPDRLARSGRAPRVEVFEGRRIIEEGGVRIEAIDIGAASDHTDEYVVFYLPRQRLLFQGDLGWTATPDGGIRAGRRAAGLHAVIVDQRLDVQTLVQGWPVTGQPRSVSIAELRRALSRGERP